MKNKKTLATVFAIFVLLILCGGISFAAYNYISNASDNAITSGQITMSYTEPSNTVVLKNALPKIDDLGKTQDEYFEFSVMSNAKTNENDDKGIEIPYEVSIEKITSGASLKDLKDDQIKIYLTKLEGETETEVLGPILISELEGSNYNNQALTIYKQVNNHKNNNGAITTKFRLRFWIDNLVDVSNWNTANEYEYKFKVNVNSKADNLDVENVNALTYKIKNSYNNDNGGTVTDDDGNITLKGVETATTAVDSSMETLSMFAEYGNVYLYREEADAQVTPTSAKASKNITTKQSKVIRVNDSKEYTFNQVQLESDIKNYLINNPDAEMTEDGYNTLTGPFGGYTGLILGAVAGVIDTENHEYVEGYTIDDIPTMDQVMADPDMSSSFMEIMADVLPDVVAYNKESFIKMYLKDDTFNTTLLNDNLEANLIAMGLGDYIDVIKTNFGSLSNYFIAEINGMANGEELDEGYTIEDIPTLETIFLNASNILLLDKTYIKLNNMLWEILGINKDDSIRLISTESINLNSKFENYLEGEVAKYFGYNDYKNTSPFLELIKGTTLGNIIVKTNYEYEESGNNSKVQAYASLPSYNDIMNTTVDGYSYLDANYVSISKIVKDNGVYYHRFYFGDNGIQENRDTIINVFPIITIKNIEVVGEGTKTDPYRIENEIISTEQQVAGSISNTILQTSSGLYNFDMLEAGYNYNPSLSSFISIENDKYSTGISMNEKCYYNTIEGANEEIEYSGNCGDKFVKISSQPNQQINTYSFNETTMSVTTNNATSYQWQQKIGDEWVDLEDYTGRITGSQTNELKIVPTSYFSPVNYFRCIISNNISKTATNTIVVNMDLTDGEWVYEEIEETNQYQIISYIGNHNDSSYFTLLAGGENYHMDFPTVINGDTIIGIESLIQDTAAGNSTWGPAGNATTAMTIPTGIKRFNANVSFIKTLSGQAAANGSGLSTSNLTELTIEEGVESIGNNAFESAKLTELETPSTLKSLGEHAFYNSPITTLTLNEGLIDIGYMTFYSTKLTTLELPNTLKTIGGSAFVNSQLTSLVLGNNLESIGDSAFKNAKLTTLELPNGVKRIEAGAFYNSPLTNLILNENIGYIGQNTFYCSNLTSLELPSSLKEIGDSAFFGADLTSLIINNGLEKIGNYAFNNSVLTELEIPSTVKTIGKNAFYNSKLTNLTLHEGLEKIDEGAFYKSVLTNLEIPRTVKTIYPIAFNSSPLTNLTLHEGLEKIYGSAFNNANLTRLNIPSTVDTIYSTAFGNSRFTDLKIYGKTSLSDFSYLASDAITMEDGYELQYIPGSLE